MGYGVDRRPDDRWFESHFGKNFSLRNFGNSVYPACQCLSDETVKAVGPFYLVSGALECVTVVDSTSHSKPPRSVFMRLKKAALH